MTWWPWPWRRKIEIEQSREAVRVAEELRDRAQWQQRRAEAIAPRVDAVASSLRAHMASPDPF